MGGGEDDVRGSAGKRSRKDVLMPLVTHHVGVSFRCPHDGMDVRSQRSTLGIACKFILKFEWEFLPASYWVLGVHVRRNSKLQQFGWFVSIYPAFKQQSRLKYSGGFPRWFQRSKLLRQSRVLLGVEEEVKRSAVDVGRFHHRNAPDNHGPHVPVPNADHNAVLLFGMLHSVERWLAVSQLEISLALLVLELSIKRQNGEPRHNRSNPTAERSNPFPEARVLPGAEEPLVKSGADVCERNYAQHDRKCQVRPVLRPKIQHLHPRENQTLKFEARYTRYVSFREPEPQGRLM